MLDKEDKETKEFLEELQQDLDEYLEKKKMITAEDLIDFDKDVKVQPDEKEPMSLEEYLQERMPISEELEKEFEVKIDEI